MVIPKKTNFSREGSNIFQGGPGGWSNFFRGGGGVRVQLAIPIETLSFFLPLRLNPLRDIRWVFGNTKF